jgi:16S rRNA G966 N2-methylase RsmD
LINDPHLINDLTTRRSVVIPSCEGPAFRSVSKLVSKLILNPSHAAAANLPTPAFDDPKHHLRIYQADCLKILAAIPENSVDLVFADPPYFLSNSGITCHAGKMVSVHKGDWDKSRGLGSNHNGQEHARGSNESQRNVFI